jgi:hypothetical protein
MVEWSGSVPVRLSGEPELRPNGPRMNVGLWLRGIWVSHPDWQGRFMSEVSKARIHAYFSGHVGPGNRYSLTGSCPEADLEEYVDHVESMIVSANDWFETEILPGLVAWESQQRQAEEAKRAEDAALKERAKNLRRPA